MSEVSRREGGRRYEAQREKANPFSHHGAMVLVLGNVGRTSRGEIIKGGVTRKEAKKLSTAVRYDALMLKL